MSVVAAAVPAQSSVPAAESSVPAVPAEAAVPGVSVPAVAVVRDLVGVAHRRRAVVPAVAVASVASWINERFIKYKQKQNNLKHLATRPS